jgi:hypothetical protein
MTVADVAVGAREKTPAARQARWRKEITIDPIRMQQIQDGFIREKG